MQVPYLSFTTSVLTRDRSSVAGAPRKRLAGALAAGLIGAGLGLAAGPASANPLSDCFERIAVAFHPHHHHPAASHPPIHRVHHHVGPRRHLRRVAAATAPRAYALRSRYILRPRACGVHPAGLLMSAIPGAPAPPEDVLAALAAPAATDVGSDTAARSAAAPAAEAPTDFAPADVAPGGFGGFPGTTPGGFGPPPSVEGPLIGPVEQPPVVGPVLPGTPITSPPITSPPDTPSVPGLPPVVPPDTFTPPDTVTPPDTFTPLVPVVEGPQPGGVPEPATWALYILGLGGVGGLVRRRSGSGRDRDAAPRNARP